MKAAFERLPRYLLVLVCGAAITAVFLISPKATFSQSGGTPITGWAWGGEDTNSDGVADAGVGWISLHCSTDPSGCNSSAGNWGLSIDSTGTITGYAWSGEDTNGDGIADARFGWISANPSDLIGCPAAPCTARMNNFAMEGWMKALAANDTEAGGWDGFISLSGSNYGPTLSGGVIAGYVWGDMNIGWLSFSSLQHSAQTAWLPQCAQTYVCTDGTHRQNQCPGASVEACSGGLICATGACVIPPAPTPSGSGDQLKVNPQLIGPGRTTLVTWNIAYADSCTVTEDNSSITDSWTGSTGSHTSSPISRQTIYTLQCTGAGGSLTERATVYQIPNWKEI